MEPVVDVSERDEMNTTLPGIPETEDQLEVSENVRWDAEVHGHPVRSLLGLSIEQQGNNNRLLSQQGDTALATTPVTRLPTRSTARHYALHSHGLRRIQLQTADINESSACLSHPNLLDDVLVSDQMEFNSASSGRQRHQEKSMVPGRVFPLTSMVPTSNTERGDHATTSGGDADDLYEEEDENSRQPLRTLNVRASLNKAQLWVFDFKTWIHRQSQRVDTIPILRKEISTIEGLFGTGYASFFVFTRTILLLNVFLGVNWLMFVITPMIVHTDYEAEFSSFHIQNLFNGKGPVEEVWIFYGGFASRAGDYRMDLAYFCLIALTFFGSFFFILNRVANAQSGVSSLGSFVSEDPAYSYSHILLTSWDYALSSREATEKLSSGVANTVKDKISDELAEHKTKALTRKQKVNLYVRRSFAWFLAVGIMAGTCTAIFFLVAESVVRKQGETEGSVQQFLQTYGVSVGFSIINGTVPFLLQQLVRIEDYVSGSTEIYVTLFRTFSLRIINVYVLMISLVLQIQEDVDIECGGTYIGQEFYKVVILDTVVQAFLQLVIQFGYYYWFNEKRVFRIPDAVLAIVYRQALVWVGTFVCPWLPLIGVLSNLVFFLVYYYVVKVTCCPPEKRWSQSRNNVFYLGCLAITLLFIIVPVSIALTQENVPLAGNVTETISGSMTGTISGNTSNVSSCVSVFKNSTCGPFKEPPPTMVVTRLIEGLPEVPRVVLKDYILSSTTALPLIFVMLSIIYYQWKRIKTEAFQKQLLVRDLDSERQEKRSHMRTCDCESMKSYRESKAKLKKGRRRYSTIIYATDVLSTKS